jgi:DNA gyrase subunit A
METGNWAAPRYTSSRLSQVSNYLFADIDKNVITEWRDNYDDTEQYPTVLPSKGYYNIVNGTLGIGVGAASSIPQFNINDVNNALIKLLWNPDISFEEIYCPPDFATGGILLNEGEVKDSLKKGTGFACKLRAVVEYDTKERCLIATEIPYGVYTNTICGELEAILEAEDNPGIDRFNDLTGSTPLIKIYLTKRANVDKVIKYLYKNTSLQSYYGINMTMLENGRYPRVFGWKEALQSHLIHEEQVYRLGFEFDLKKIKDRLHILEGLFIALANIEEVVQTIKSSSSPAIAKKNLQDKFLLSEVQAKAILDMKLSRLANLEVKKLENEKEELLKKQAAIEAILENKELLFKEIEKGLLEITKKFGDSHRTKVLNIEKENDEPIEVRSLVINLTNQNNIFVTETSSLTVQRRGGVGNKFKLNNGEYVLSSITAENTDTILFFTQSGNFYHCSANSITLEEKLPIETLVQSKNNEAFIALSSLNKKTTKENIIFFTKQGFMKKSLLSEYNIKRSGGVKALELQPNDEICSVVFTDNSKVAILTKQGQFLIFSTQDVRPIGRVAKGVKSIKLNEDDEVVSAKIIPNTTKEIISVTKMGYCKRTSIDEFSLGSRYTKGSKLHKLKSEEDTLKDFAPIESEQEVVFTSTAAQLRIKIEEINLLSKGAQGVKSINLKNEKDFIVGISKL